MKKLSILFAAFAVLFLVSCGKYEDGPGFSLRSKKARVCGSWTYDKILIDDVDVTANIVAAGEDYTWVFNKDGMYEGMWSFPGGWQSSNGNWFFENKQEDIVFPDFNGDPDIYKILRLTNTEFWFSKTEYGSTKEYHLKAK